MSNLEELKEALAEAIEEDRVACKTGTSCSEALMDFANVAAALMPQLLTAVALLDEMQADYGFNRSDEKRAETLVRVRRLLKGLI